jgi:hypothetical protein
MEERIMKNAVVLFAVCLAAGCVSTGNTSKGSAAMELFNGKDLSGWEFSLKDDADPAQTWTVEDGVIKCKGTPNGYMRTKESYSNYRLTVEWRFTKEGNSGVLLHINGPDQVWPKSVETQGMYGKQGDIYLIGGAECAENRETGKRKVPMKEPSNEKPVGEWNTYEIVCDGATVRPYVNGKLMNEATECSIAAGMIGLQSEGGVWECRRITLEPLNE